MIIMVTSVTLGILYAPLGHTSYQICTTQTTTAHVPLRTAQLAIRITALFLQ
jgi:hypothetical protein